MDDLKQYIPAIVTFILLLWSEYLGITPKHKSNSIAQLLICALTPKPEDDDGPSPNIIAQPSSNPPPSS